MQGLVIALAYCHLLLQWLTQRLSTKQQRLSTKAFYKGLLKNLQDFRASRFRRLNTENAVYL